MNTLPMKKVQQGFTLIELMIVVAIIGILAAIAIPAYQDYITRSKISELVIAADSCKTSVTEYYQSTNGLPADLAASGCATQDTQYVASIDVANGIVTVTGKTGATALPVEAAGAYILEPTINAANPAILDWSCKGATTPSTILAKYLPANCR